MNKETGLILVLFSVFFLFLGARGLNEPDEGRYAEIAREMVVSGDWLTPHLNGFEHFQKPPLLYWATALSFKTFGIHEWSARLPSTLAALGILGLTAAIASVLFGRKLVLPTLLVLGSSLLFFALARFLTPDMLMTFFIVAAMTCLVQAAFGKSGGAFWSWAFFGAMGLGFLTKGPMSLIIPLCAALALRHGLRRSDRPLRLPWVRGLILTLALSLSWFVVMVWQHPGLTDYFLGYELVQRFGSQTHGRSQPMWFFVPILFLAFLPWSFFLPGMIWSAGKRLRSRIPLASEQWFLLGWVVPPFLILSLSGSKLPTYILPLLPALALAVACRWDRKNKPFAPLLKISMGSLALLLAAVSQAEKWNDYFGRQASVRSLVQTLRQISPVQPAPVFAAGVRAHGLEFYLGQTISVVRADADLVLPLTAGQKKRLFNTSEDIEKEMAGNPKAYGIVPRRDLARLFPQSTWEIVDTAGDFVLIRPR